MTSEKNEQLKLYFERRFSSKTARANGTILGYATGYYVVSAIVRYLGIHPDRSGRTIKVKKLAQYGTPRPLRVRESDGLRFYRLLKLAEDSNLLEIESRKQFWDGAIGVVVHLNSDAKLSDYEVEWPEVPEKPFYGYDGKIKGEDFVILEPERIMKDSGETFWNDGWTEYDAKFIYKGIYAMLLEAARDRNDKRRIVEVKANFNKLYPMLTMIEEECAILLHQVSNTNARTIS